VEKDLDLEKALVLKEVTLTFHLSKQSHLILEEKVRHHYQPKDLVV